MASKKQPGKLAAKFATMNINPQAMMGGAAPPKKKTTEGAAPADSESGTKEPGASTSASSSASTVETKESSSSPAGFVRVCSWSVVYEQSTGKTKEMTYSVLRFASTELSHNLRAKIKNKRRNPTLTAFSTAPTQALESVRSVSGYFSRLFRPL